MGSNRYAVVKEGKELSNYAVRRSLIARMISKRNEPDQAANSFVSFWLHRKALPSAVVSTLAVTLYLLTAAAAPAVGLAAPHPCGPRGGHELVESSGGRVFSIGEDEVFACLRGQRRTTRLRFPTLSSPPWRGGSIDLVRLAPPFVAYSWFYVSEDLRRSGVAVKNLKLNSPAAEYGPVKASVVSASVPALVLAHDGSVAWTGLGWHDALANTLEVVQVDTGQDGMTTVLDEGTGIDYESLALTGNRLSWMNGNATRRAILH
jgi:hypothetical protein